MRGVVSFALHDQSLFLLALPLSIVLAQIKKASSSATRLQSSRCQLLSLESVGVAPSLRDDKVTATIVVGLPDS